MPMSGPAHTYVAVVDDDEALRRSLSRLLRAAGFQPIVYASGEAFLGDRNQPRFDCLLLDVRMGGMSGIELQKRLADAKSQTPIIFITAHDDPKVREEAIGAGCAGFFSKNDSGDSILSAIRTAMEEKHAPP